MGGDRSESGQADGSDEVLNGCLRASDIVMP